MAREPTESLGSRAAALELLLRVEKGSFLDAILGPAVERLQDRRDAALLTRLAYGVETWRDRLDWTLRPLSNDRLEGFEPAVRGALRLGLFQILFLDRVPDHAAVDTSVELAKKRTKAGAKVVNAILRRVLREGETPPPPDGDDPTAHLAIRWSHPTWLVERWLAERGRAATEALLEANTLPGPTAFRVDLRRTSREDVLRALAERDVVAHASPLSPTALEIEGPVSAVLGIEHLTSQGVASQIVAQMVAPSPSERVLDLCAAPGGKASALAEVVESGLVVATDRARGGISHVAARRAGRDRLVVARADGTHAPFREASFDVAVVDAPCSGLGTLRAHPEVRWRRGPTDVARLAALQRRLLDAAAPLVRPGGRMVYATCTLVAEENEDNTAGFLAAHPEWKREDPRAQIPAAAHLVGNDLALHTSPEHDGLDGFYAVVLRNAPGGL